MAEKKTETKADTKSDAKTQSKTIGLFGTKEKAQQKKPVNRNFVEPLKPTKTVDVIGEVVARNLKEGTIANAGQKSRPGVDKPRVFRVPEDEYNLVKAIGPAVQERYMYAIIAKVLDGFINGYDKDGNPLINKEQRQLIEGTYKNFKTISELSKSIHDQN